MSVKPRSEKGFQAAVVQLARDHRWRVCEFRKVLVKRPNGSVYWATPFGADGKGFFDLVLCRAPRVVYAELKMPGNDLEPEQRLWADEVRACGGEVYAWWPDDWDEIVSVLSRGA